jgi:hypothetical protein
MLLILGALLRAIFLLPIVIGCLLILTCTSATAQIVFPPSTTSYEAVQPIFKLSSTGLEVDRYLRLRADLECALNSGSFAVRGYVGAGDKIDTPLKVSAIRVSIESSVKTISADCSDTTECQAILLTKSVGSSCGEVCFSMEIDDGSGPMRSKRVCLAP